MKSPFVVAVAGGSGSGKTTVVRMIKEKCTHKSITVFSQDHYYRDQSHLSEQERELVNFDHPHSIDDVLLCQQLKQLVGGQVIKQPHYDFSTHTRSKGEVELQPVDIILVDGIFGLYYPELLKMADLKLYIDVSDDIRFIRRLRRDMQERARSMDSVINQYLSTVRPMHNQFVEPTKKNADFVVLWEERNMATIDRLVGMLS